MRLEILKRKKRKRMSEENYCFYNAKINDVEIAWAVPIKIWLKNSLKKKDYFDLP